MPASIVQSCDGPMLVPHYDHYVTKSLVLYGAYCMAQRQFLKPYAKGVVYDCGANVGGHALWMARQSDWLVAFEPQPFLYDCLCGNFALGGVQNKTLLNCAVSDCDGTVSMPAFHYRTANHYAGLSMDNEICEGHPTVQARKVRMDSLGLPAPDFVMLDVEGWELEALRGMEGLLSQKKPVLCVEYDKPSKREGIVAWLKDHGYEAWLALAPMGECWPEEASWDLLCVHPESGVPAPTLEELEKVV